MMSQHFFNCWNVPEISRVSQRVLGLNLSEEEGEGEGQGWNSLRLFLWSNHQSLDSVPSLVPCRTCGLRAKPLSLSHSHLRARISEHILFLYQSYIYFCLVLKQPSWPHLKEGKGDTYPKASFSTRGSCTGRQTSLVSTLPFCLK